MNVSESLSSSNDEKYDDPILIDSFSSTMGKKSNTDTILIESSSDDGKKSAKTKPMPKVVVESFSSSDDETNGFRMKGKGALGGIRNPNNNCFLNSVLQSVCHIPQFGRYIVEIHQRSSNNCYGNWCLLCDLKHHFEHSIVNHVVDANWINRYLDDIFPNHIRGSQEDAHEMLLFLLDAIDRQQQKIRRSHPGKNSSIVEQIFDGKVRCEYTCQTCQKKIACYEPIRGLSIELPENPEFPPEMSKIVEDYFNDEKICHYDCRNCKTNTVACKRTRIVTAPRVLIIQLKRFLSSAKINTPVVPTRNINLGNVMHDSQSVPYRLLGFIRHHGIIRSSGHYTATMCGFNGKSFYNFDDEKTRQVASPGEPIQPYILFYSCSLPSINLSSSSKSPLPTPEKKPNLNASISQKNPSFTVKKDLPDVFFSDEEKENDEEFSRELRIVSIESSSDDGRYGDTISIESSSDDGKKSAKTKPMPKVVVESFSSSDDEKYDDPVSIESFSSTMGKKILIESLLGPRKKYIKKKTKLEIIDLDPYIKGEKRFYGGKMTDKRKEKIAAVTEEVIEQIHGSLDSMPENVVTETPEDLTVDLMLHQKHGLTWMKWRENNKAPRGGILADDMGLGKTLSVISLILSQLNDQKNSAEVKEKLAADMRKHFSYEKDVHPGYCTLVVAPASVIYQWEKEIKDRVKPGKLEVYVFHGPRRERDPMKLANNDIVITTYNTISSELGEDKDFIGQDSDDDANDEKWYSKSKSGSKKGISKRNTKSVLTQIGWERIVLDEAHNIKNTKSLMSKGCCRLLAFKRWALTGTPIHNELWDFYSLVKFLRISPFSDQRYWKEYMIDMSGKVATERLNILVKSILLRRTKNQICSVTNKPLVVLKPRKFEVVEIHLKGAEEKCYRHMMEASKQKAKELINQQDNYSSRHRKCTNVIKNPFVVGNREVDLADKFQMMSCLLVLLLRLRQACVHMALTKQAIDLDAFKDDGGEGAGDVMDELEKTFGNISLGAEEMIAQENKAIDKIFEPEYASAKLKVLFEKIGQVIENGDKCVIVSQWTSVLEIVEQHLKKKKLKLTAINGKVLTKDRQERINSFNQKNGGAQVMLLSLTAGGVGLNLVGGNHLFLLDFHWNPALEQRACDCIYRVGQTKDVFIHKLICEDTIEQRVLDLQERKVQLATSVRERAAKKQNKLTVNDLKFLFGLTKEQQQKPKPKEPYQGSNNNV